MRQIDESGSPFAAAGVAPAEFFGKDSGDGGCCRAGGGGVHEQGAVAAGEDVFHVAGQLKTGGVADFGFGQGERRMQRDAGAGERIDGGAVGAEYVVRRCGGAMIPENGGL